MRSQGKSGGKVRPGDVTYGCIGQGGQRSLESEAGSALQETSELSTMGKLGLWVRFKGRQSLLGFSASFQDRSLANREK